MATFRQSEETRYDNNEFDDMPSIDYWGDSVELHKNNMGLVDWQEVGRICEEYGFQYAAMHGTYGNSTKVIIYEKLDIDPNVYKELVKQEDYTAIRQLVKETRPRYLQLHMCVNELDRQTNLYFSTGWSGNCGIFGSNDVDRRSYSFGDMVYSWENFIDHFSHYCYDTTNRPRKGIYLYMETDRAKIDTSYIYEDFSMGHALEVARGLFPNETIELLTGKRECDTASAPYQAIVVGQGANQVGSLTFSKSAHGVVSMSVRVPLAGEHGYKIKRDKLSECLRDAIQFMLN